MNSHASDKLIEALQDPALYPHPVREISVRETHISWVILTGDFAYKIKKPLNLGFLDYSSLESRRHYCFEELRLNGRYSPDLYLEVVPICGQPGAPVFAGAGDPIEYAVKMRQFDQQALLSRLAAAGTLEARHIDAMAGEIAGFHSSTASAAADQPFGEPGQVQDWSLENFHAIRPLLSGLDAEQEEEQRLQRLESWTRAAYTRLRPCLEERRARGYIRECHGDLHLGNMFAEDGRVRLFDCIEFNPGLHWIDVMSEVAFVFMDLRDRDHGAYAWRFLNHYLHYTGDYAGLATLAYYVVYRALVRAKVTLLRLGQGHLPDAELQSTVREYRGYIDLALAEAGPPAPGLILTRGPSGVGKSVLAEQLGERLGAVHMRSDVERKRLHGLGLHEDSGSEPGTGIYTREDTRATYARLLELAGTVLAAGCCVIVDATFLQAQQRTPFLELARRQDCGFLILDLQAPGSVLRERVCRRQQAGSDASEADTTILEHQLHDLQPLTAEELPYSLQLDTSAEIDWDHLLQAACRCRRSPSGSSRPGTVS